MEYTLKQLEDFPTLLQGHMDDLKIEANNTRVWLSRMTIEDGQPYNNQVTIEKYIHYENKGSGKYARWETVKSYEAK